MNLVLKTIEAKETAFLRQAVLRPHQSLKEMVYPNDNVDGAIHLGAFENNELVGIASIYPETQSGDTNQRKVWRLRGMATAESARGKAYGKSLLREALKRAHAEGGEKIWCNARVSACGFYSKFGFQKEGDERHLSLFF